MTKFGDIVKVDGNSYTVVAIKNDSTYIAISPILEEVYGNTNIAIFGAIGYLVAEDISDISYRDIHNYLSKDEQAHVIGVSVDSGGYNSYKALNKVCKDRNFKVDSPLLKSIIASLQEACYA